MSVFLISRASFTVRPLIHSVASEELAMAEPQPKVLNLASSMTWVSGLTRDLQAHHVAALRRADQAGADFGRALVQRAHIAADCCSGLRLCRCMPLGPSLLRGGSRVYSCWIRQDSLSMLLHGLKPLLLKPSLGMTKVASKLQNLSAPLTPVGRLAYLAPPQVSVPATRSWSGQCLPSPSHRGAKARVASSRYRRSPWRPHSPPRPGY